MKVAVITGHRGGLGSALFAKLTSCGFECIGLDLPEYDFRDSEALNSRISQFAASQTTISVLINCAGVSVSKDLEKTSYKEMRDVLSVNFEAPFLISSLLWNNLCSAPDGLVINICSSIFSDPKPQSAIYGCSKAALSYLTMSETCQRQQDRPRICGVAPDYINTPMLEKFRSEASPGSLDNDVVPLDVSDVVQVVIDIIYRPDEWHTGTVRTISKFKDVYQGKLVVRDESG